MGSLRNRIFVIQKPVPISLDMFSEKDKIWSGLCARCFINFISLNPPHKSCKVYINVNIYSRRNWDAVKQLTRVDTGTSWVRLEPEYNSKIFMFSTQACRKGFLLSSLNPSLSLSITVSLELFSKFSFSHQFASHLWTLSLWLVWQTLQTCGPTVHLTRG